MNKFNHPKVSVECLERAPTLGVNGFTLPLLDAGMKCLGHSYFAPLLLDIAACGSIGTKRIRFGEPEVLDLAGNARTREVRQMHWSLLTIILAMLFLGCKKKESNKAAPTKQSASSSPTEKNTKPLDAGAKPTASAPADLPICSDAKDRPLAALCRIGGPAGKAHFECERPEPISFCATWAQWSCRTLSALTGVEPPAVQFSATYEWKGLPVKPGDRIDTSKIRREGTVKGVRVSFAEANKTTGKEKVEQYASEFVKWGCVRTSREWQHQFECGTWTATVDYNDIIDKVFVSAALTGFKKCEGSP